MVIDQLPRNSLRGSLTRLGLGVHGGSPRPSQLQIQPTHQRRQDQGNGEQWHSMPRTHSE